MKKNELLLTSTQVAPAIEDSIRQRDTALKELAEKNARHFAKRNLPAPIGDCLAHYVGELKAGYEKLAADIFQKLQPAAHIPEAKIEADFYREKVNELDAAIKEKEHQNHNDEYELHGFNPGTIHARIWWAIIATFIITIGEILFNTKAFQVTGENMLFALILSISVSFAVYVFSHIVPFLYKAAKTKLQRRLVIGLSLLLITALFTALAIFRSAYLASQDVHINPIYFVLINLFFFIVSSLLSFFVLPTWAELKENAHRLKLYRALGKRRKEIVQLKMEKEAIKETILARTKQRMRIVHSANYSADIFRKMYKESVEVFKRANLTYRTDKKTPDCFSEELGDADIRDILPTLLIDPINRHAQ